MLRQHLARRLSYAAGLSSVLLLLSACSSSKSTAPPPAAPAPQLWGDMKPIVSVKELMRFMIDPASDNIFDAVKIVTTKTGTIDRVPKTDEDWEKIKIGAVTLAEGVYLLKVARPFAPPGDNNSNTTGPDATELTPAQIEAKRAKDPVLWDAKIEALRNVGLEVMDIVKNKKTSELWDASYNLDQACESCHLEYWYPGDKALLQKVDKQLFELYGKPSTPSPSSGSRKP
jgi:hypothetical protein